MSTPSIASLQYPIGPRPKFAAPFTADERARCIAELAAAPLALRSAVHRLSDDRLATPYRPDGWTVRQVVHHLADAHLHFYTRVRLALIESEPRLTPFHENAWAELEDAVTAPVEPSLALFDAMHGRLDLLLRGLSTSQFERTMIHPYLSSLTLDALMGIFSWHARHHTAQITSLRQREEW